MLLCQFRSILRKKGRYELRRAFFVFLFLLVLRFSLAEECTTGIVSHELTKDGHLILWKNRDTKNADNELHFFDYKGFSFLGIINADDTTQVWAGVSNFGFAIMNAESRDMAKPGEDTKYDGEGFLMKKALRNCRTVEDFERILQETNQTGRDVTSNFGVVDVYGNGAFFEVGNHEYFRYDVADTFLVRANFAFKGYAKEAYGKERYLRARYLISREIENGLSCTDFIFKIARDFYVYGGLSCSPENAIEKEGRQLVNTSGSINRFRTVSVALFEVIPDTAFREFVTFWYCPGEPSVSVFVPVWVYSRSVPVELDSIGFSPLNRLFQRLKFYVYDDERLLDLGKYRRVRTRLDRLQGEIVEKTYRVLKKWTVFTPSRKEVADYQKKIAKEVYWEVRELLGEVDK